MDNVCFYFPLSIIHYPFSVISKPANQNHADCNQRYAQHARKADFFDRNIEQPVMVNDQSYEHLPAMTRLKVRATQRRGTSVIVAATKNAPRIPPVQATIDAFFAKSRFPSGIPVARNKKNARPHQLQTK